MKNTFVKVLSMMMALMMVVGILTVVPATAAECTHENCTKQVIAPKCATAGFTKVVCNDCGHESIENIIPATGECTYETMPGTPANCFHPAYQPYKKCTVCGDEVGKNVPVPNSTPRKHVYNIPYEFEATCTENGFTSRKCAYEDCGHVDTREYGDKEPSDENGWKKITKLASHDLVYKVITAPGTCSQGSYSITCNNCDYSKLIADTNKHSDPVKVTSGKVELAGEGWVVVGSGCGAKYKEVQYCAKCKVKLAATPNDDFGHSATSETITGTVVTPGSIGILSATDINEQITKDTGLVLNSPVRVEPTCTENGYQLKKCDVCGIYYKATLDKPKDHRWNAGVTPTVNHTVDTIKTYTCLDGCGATKTELVKAATPHSYVKADGKDNKVVEPMRCTSNGYTTWTCVVEGCGYSYVSDIVYASGHDWTAWAFASKSTPANDEGCTSTAKNAMVRTCKNENCSGLFNETWGFTTQESNKTKHTFEVVTTPATCQKDAFSENVCKDCGFNAGTTGVKQPAAGKNPANHVVKDVNLGNTSVDFLKSADLYVAEGSIDKFLAVTQNQSCTTDQKADWACACGVKVTIVVNKAPGHTIVEGQKKTFGEGATAFTRDFRDIPSKCHTAGQTAGKFCNVCGAVDTAPTPKPYDSKVHEQAGTPVGGRVLATCVAKAYDRVYYPCCGAIIDTEVATSTLDANNHPNAKKVAMVPATCLATGMDAYYFCDDCDKYMKVGTDGKYDPATAKATLAELNLVLPKLSGDKGNHEWIDGTEYAAKEETCDAIGYKAYKECKFCDAWLVDGVVVFDDPATTGAGKDEQYNAIVIKAHGTQYMERLSYLNSTKDPGCFESVYKNIPTDRAICKKCDLKHYVVKNEGHVGGETLHYENIYGFSATYYCDKPSYIVHKCKTCNAEYVTNYTKAAKDAHKYLNDKGEYINTVVYNPNRIICKENEILAHACDNANCSGVEYTNGTAATGHFYVTLGGNVAISFNCTDKADNMGLTCASCKATVADKTLVHNYVTEKFDATCTEDGYYVEYCKDCDHVNSATTTDKLGHSEKSTLIETVNGVKKYSCPVCGEYWTEAVAPVVVETYTLSANKVAAGEIITVTYAISGAETKFSAKNIDVKYDADKLTFVGIEAAKINGLYAVSAEKEVYNETTGVMEYFIGVSLVVANDANGNAQKVTTTAAGTDLFTLTFIVNKTASGTANVANKSVAINAVGNLNGDANVTAEDAQAIFNKIGTNDVAADVNLDGIVNLSDVIALAKFAASGKTAADYFEMVGELDKLEDVVFALYNNDRINDIDHNGVTTIADAYALINMVEYWLMSYNYSALANVTTMEDLVAALNAYPIW